MFAVTRFAVKIPLGLSHVGFHPPGKFLVPCLNTSFLAK